PSLPGDEAKGKHRLDDAERESIARALRTTGGNMLAAARLLGIGRTTLYRKIEKYRL
ncbi:MAG: sigma-54-dependent Fis family transcriptional regulator, partial [Bacteroidetes bacterium HGW-Bacteroidetes-22]